MPRSPLGATTDYYGFYAVDALDLTGSLTLTVGLRINAADIVTRDRSGMAAELNGTHGYGHVNPLAGPDLESHGRDFAVRQLLPNPIAHPRPWNWIAPILRGPVCWKDRWWPIRRWRRLFRIPIKRVCAAALI
jgi:hypothetical protein